MEQELNVLSSAPAGPPGTGRGRLGLPSAWVQPARSGPDLVLPAQRLAAADGARDTPAPGAQARKHLLAGTAHGCSQRDQPGTPSNDNLSGSTGAGTHPRAQQPRHPVLFTPSHPARYQFPRLGGHGTQRPAAGGRRAPDGEAPHVQDPLQAPVGRRIVRGLDCLVVLAEKQHPLPLRQVPQNHQGIPPVLIGDPHTRHTSSVGTTPPNPPNATPAHLSAMVRVRGPDTGGRARWRWPTGPRRWPRART